tara:strand:+ start:2023 stop:2547 length:525 start_codon:yes stop_codon:yes gene_type:complete
MFHYQFSYYKRNNRGEISMGYWVGFTAKNGKECNFYVEDDRGKRRFYNGKDKKNEYRSEEPYDTLEDNTPKVIERKIIPDASEPIQSTHNRPVLEQEVKEANAERFVALKTDLGQQAKALLSEGRLNHTTFTKLISNKASLTDKKLSKPKYDAIIKELIDNEIAEKKGLNYIYK